MSVSKDYQKARLDMVSGQIERRGVKDRRVLEAMRKVPRHEFVPPSQQDLAYEDFPLRIGHGQTISQPYIVALMTEMLQPYEDDIVLEIGTGSGYQAAVLSQLVKSVYTVERIPELAENAQAVFNKLQYKNIHCHLGDGTLGWEEHAPFDAILVSAAAPDTPQAYFAQLSQKGRIIIPVGSRTIQELIIWQKQNDHYNCQNHIPVAFVPLIGEDAWDS